MLAEGVIAKWGRIDILINNAGLNVKNRASADLDPETWDKLIRINLDGAFYAIHAVLPDMRRRKDGIVVNISSVVGKRANPLGGAGYNAAKFGMTALGLTLSVEEKDNNIRVTNIYPGEVDTPLLNNRPQPVTAEHRARAATGGRGGGCHVCVLAAAAGARARIGDQADLAGVFLRKPQRHEDAKEARRRITLLRASFASSCLCGWFILPWRRRPEGRAARSAGQREPLPFAFARPPCRLASTGP